ncbi:calcium/sodium antiporter [Aquisalimonas sp.]|uniref:calcium/sodium antiporter n=1 Tax=Aquisalimonas sp. TaxID=1872621 RepID=UPI0025C55140|nr:calcium/sodium antiporter [Aquisalimonas sp.]
MIVTGLQLVAGLTLLYFGAEWLVRGASALGLRLGLTPLVIGLTVVAFGTSAPELAVSLEAGLAGRGAIALGNVIGSNIANIALILGIAALVRPLSVQAQVIRIEVPLMIGASLLLCALLWNGVLGRVEGAGLVLALVTYVVYSVRAARAETNAIVTAEYADLVPAAVRPLWHYALLAVVGLALLVTGANLLVDASVEIARHFGLREALIGLTIIAVGTSLPELATSAVASRRGEGDIAVGNVLGSNLFNILCVLGLAAFVVPLAVGDVSWVDLGVMVGFALVALPVLRSGFVISRIEGALLLTGYAVYLGWLVANA